MRDEDLPEEWTGPQVPVGASVCFSFRRRRVLVERVNEGWSSGGRLFPDLRELGREVVVSLEARSEYGLIIAFDGPGVVGRIRDAGGPRESYIVDLGDSAMTAAGPLDKAVAFVLEKLVGDDDLPSSSGDAD